MSDSYISKIETSPGQRSLFPECTYAEFSEDRIYRYSLTRVWKLDGRLVNFIMLNPSTADEVYNDPTITRCMKYAQSWGYDGLVVTNLFALRSTDPKSLKSHPDPIGPENLRYLFGYAWTCDLVVCAWGIHGSYLQRGIFIESVLRKRNIPISYLSLTKRGHPGHPLYLYSGLKPTPWINQSYA